MNDLIPEKPSDKEVQEKIDRLNELDAEVMELLAKKNIKPLIIGYKVFRFSVNKFLNLIRKYEKELK